MSTRTHLGVTRADDGFKGAHRGQGQKRDLCIMACVFCRDPKFYVWMIELASVCYQDKMVSDPQSYGEDAAKAFILSLCQTDSRSKLDTDAAAGALFMELVRAPFLAWKEQQ